MLQQEKWMMTWLKKVLEKFCIFSISGPNKWMDKKAFVYFFLRLSCGYNGRICLYTRTPTQHTHTTHTTRVQTNLQLQSDLKTASFLRSPKSSDFVGDRHVTNPLWLHVRDRHLEPAQMETVHRVLYSIH
jgi:hypothetical protein